MASKVLVKLPTVAFPKGKKSQADIVPLPERNEGLNKTLRLQNINVDRVAQLEQNMKFLQEQHQATLVALHQEVESLRQKNRDLQFQLVFSKGSTYAPSTPSSPEDNGTGFVKAKGSPVCVNIAPLQVELLEKDLQDIKISLQKAKTQNQYYSEIIEQQKKKLNSIEEEKTNKNSVVDVGIQVESRFDPVQSNLVTRLEVTEKMVKRLLKQNEDKKKELEVLTFVLSNKTSANRGAQSQDSNNSHHSRGSPTSTTQEQTPKFPPLQSQSYWHRRVPRNERNRHDKQDHQTEESALYRSRGYRNYYRDESNRKYRGQMSQKDRRDHHLQHLHNLHRRDDKDRNSKDHKKEFAGSAEGSREPDNSAGSKS
ncbi:uncharacterized protein LOC128886625 [Hylaeus anthracinus]|uniref:uncharacterized protein LOC128878915 n=1 Tax=Hylaeus volcanicus TaxID=313075 RepID=UPI0023B86965|nr:uncharacterized protein LOC128878915 [Hylaeus volcanicus]XP_053983559.1 uncharacterized protein LOC128878915 [Hylaeus volcanicus]XP_053983560.1 uncharacterized protein LOC128878915 [Hylaeus volcanicus]XP_053983561.1 uncharacterized protein LOC128878915 [Hylaeus volcanicus]XP_053983563.1 uncharacterized protein LOC128878915 [Hylaeus volcanicus]XP_053983564.1 uncharacterized protein LOC128878915 [Hylaeus volcanicus]XP_053983565.1 uncharacterized protein LOC128878915 [Hylaeus volcanicus]XP_0